MAIYRLAVNIVHPAVTGPAVNIWHMRTDGDVETSTADAAMGALEDFYSALTGQMAGGSIFRWLGEMTTVGPDPVTVTPGTPWSVTTATSDFACPGPTAIMVKWGSASGGRNGKGRTFLSPVGLSHVNSNGRPATEALAAVASAAQGLLDWSMGDHGVSFGVYSRDDSLLRDFTSSSVLGKYAVLTSRRD